MGFFTDSGSSKHSEVSSRSSSPSNESSNVENRNIMYMLKNCLILSKDGNKKAICDEGVKFSGLENNLNNCYSNVVIQSLYSYHEFRNRMIKMKKTGGAISSELAKLYSKCVTQSDIQSTKGFLKKVCSTKDDFILGDQQDAHEFLTYILNAMIDEIRNLEDEYVKPKTFMSSKSGGKRKLEKKTWLNELVEGCVKSETRCHECYSVTGMTEPFITLSLNIFDNCDINLCLQRYCDDELLSGKNQFFCEKCDKYCDASKRIVFDLMPPLLILHLKRFKYTTKPGSSLCSVYERLPYSVVCSNVIQVNCKRHPCPIVYELFSIISHIGTSPDYGHYINISELGGNWFRCDDASILKLDDYHSEIGDETTSGNDASYILFYRIKE
ncbi:Ubiquitin carboxyl-terminal hydrolase family protein [Theileria parva strain Muguga]|uniref:Ubiquitin carboxyl-terminal hydrolase family protein n=1 Tax=Theileria parva strain Muguga TaxID=333668 RepID=UPI001C6173DB|nr:Ubiquitin carboxyl-terminal hydrolase family protein [Theileria parva strain Muguga]EAN32397.2 Ubiquitin carboxyl-terminal hydrolase family protein [Theileria parva strain Muguga]